MAHQWHFGEWTEHGEVSSDLGVGEREGSDEYNRVERGEEESILLPRVWTRRTSIGHLVEGEPRRVAGWCVVAREMSTFWSIVCWLALCCSHLLLSLAEEWMEGGGKQKMGNTLLAHSTLSPFIPYHHILISSTST